MKYCITIALLVASFPVLAQLKPFDASTVPQNLVQHARSVKREERIMLDVRSTDKAYYKVHRVITIFNEAGKNQLRFAWFPDQFESLEDVTIHLLDARGATLHKYSKSDLNKMAYGEGLVPDGKVYFTELNAPSYPVTVVTDFEEKYNGILAYPEYEVQLPEQSVENSVFTARVPADIDLRYKKNNCSVDPVISEDGKYKLYTWEIKDLPALEFEEGSAGRLGGYPSIKLAPNKFELDGYAGDMSTWQQFGQWYAALAKNAGNLPEERKQFFREMVKDAPNENEKIRRIYNYLQNNFRYVSIQLGIGGFKPFVADFVDKKKYGDCKALSNYTQACLNAVGIKSYQALINAEYNSIPVDPAFPQNGFNHVIVCVPMPKDSVWLECTSTTNDFGVLGSFTENRNALLITEDGGKLVPTPRSRASENIFSSNTTVNLNEDGSGNAAVILNTTGEYRQEFLRSFLEEVKDEQKNYIVNRLGFTQPDKFEIRYNKDIKNTPTYLTLEIEKIPDFSAGDKQFLNPRIYKLWKSSLPKTENRTQDFYFPFPLIKTDTTRYLLPLGFEPETMPKAKDLRFEFGSFSSTYEYDASQRAIISTARLVLNEYKIPAAKFSATKKFFADVLAEYSEKIVIKHS